MTLAEAIARSADPDGAQIRAEAILEAVDAATRDRLASGDAAGRLAALCAGSPALAEALRADADLAAFVASPASVEPPDAAAFAAEIQRIAGSHDDRLAALRRLRRREAVRSALRHLLDAAPIDVLCLEITRAADAVLSAVLAWEAERIPAAPAVVALGKLGGEELNFCSDVDLVFVAAPEVDGASMERATRLAERFVGALSAATPDGTLHRVDVRLRPDGTAGPLVRSLDSYVRYYQEAGAPWERQALIKARPIAGDAETGGRFVKAVEPFVWRRYIDRDSVEAIDEIKGKIEARVEDDSGRDVKLGFGGIREVEFIAQILQLANGGRDARVRARGTLAALAALAETRHLEVETAEALGRAYRFLRRVEHALQIAAMAPRHLLPERPDEVEILGRRLGHAGAEAFLDAYRETTRGVRAAYERLFRRAGRVALAADEWTLADALDAAEAGDDDGVEAARRRVRRLGFDEAGEALVALRSLARGGALEGRTSTVRRRFLRLSAGLLPRIRSTPDPDRTVRNLARIVGAYGARAPLYEVLLERPAVLDLLVRIAGHGAFLVERLANDPSLVEGLLAPASLAFERPPEDLAGRLAALREMGGPDAALRALHAEEVLRIGARHLLGLDAPEGVTAALSALADLVVTEALASGGAADGLAVLAAGKMGARDLRYLSDLDLVFVAGGRSTPARLERAASRARALVDNLSSLYAVDARLRPWGRSAPLVVGLAEFRRYLARDAEAWERLVWTRGRAVAGDAETADAAVRAIESFVGRRWRPADREAIRGVRRRLVAEAKGGADDPKRGAGGSMALEFLLALRSIPGAPAPPTPSPLREAESLYRRIECAVQAATGRAWTSMPEGKDLAVVAAVAGLEPAALVEAWSAARANVGAAFDAVFG